jgi:hypothetical protein
MATQSIRVITKPLLLLSEMRNNLVPAPAGSTRLYPFSKIGRMAPLMNLGIDVGRSAEHSPSWNIDLPTATIGLGLTLERPVEPALEETRKAGWYLDKLVIRFTAGLDKQDTMTTGAGQPLRQNATGRTCPNDNQILHRVIFLMLFLLILYLILYLYLYRFTVG